MRRRTSLESLSNGLEAQRSAVVADAMHDLDIHLNTPGHLRRC